MDENFLDKDIDIRSTSLSNFPIVHSKISFDFNILKSPLKEHFSSNGSLLIIFTNPLSGSREGNSILNLSQKYKIKSIENYNIISFQNNKQKQSFFDSDDNDLRLSFYKAPFNESSTFSIIVFNILNQKDFEKGQDFINDYLSYYKDNKIKIIIGGGDGTTLRLIEDLYKSNIDLNRCIFGLIPLGTGNDLSNATGFGNTVEIGNQIKQLHRILYTYYIAEECKIDIWEVIVKIKPYGSIKEIIGNRENLKIDNENKKVLLLKKSFINYMSIGFDAKIGYNF